MARPKSLDANNPYPSSPSRPPLYNLWFKYGSEQQRMQIHAWCTDWAAWKCIEIALNGRDFKLVDEDIGWYETTDGSMRFLVNQPKGQDIVSRKPQNDWVPGQPTLGQLHMIAGIVAEPDTPHGIPKNEVREANKRKTRVKAVSRDGLVSISDICNELGISPRDARKILRNKVEKPDAGWAWPESEVASIKKLLKS